MALWEGSHVGVREAAFEIAANTSAVVADVPIDRVEKYRDNDRILVCDIRGEFGTDRACAFHGMPFEMTPPPARLFTSIELTSGGGAVTVSSDGYARVVTLEADAVFDDNYFDLLPGETRRITWRNVEGLSADMRVSCWNGGR